MALCESRQDYHLMGRSTTYLVDRARIMRVVPVIDGSVISRKRDLEVVGDWINARLRPVSGNEVRELGQVKLVHTHELVLDRFDASGNEVHTIESDQFEIMVSRDNKMSKSLDKFKVSGAIQEIRKRTAVQSYVVPLVLETEY